MSAGGYLLNIADLGGFTVAGRIDEVDVVKVKAGKTTLYEVEITGGLKAGDEVIVTGS